MKTLFTFDLRIQQTLIILFLATSIAAGVMHKEFLCISIFVEFFLIAIVQYSLNIMKFLSENMQKKTQESCIFLFQPM